MIRNPKLDSMKSNSTLVVVIRIVAFILLCLYSLLVFGQQDLSLQDKSSFSVVRERQVSESALVSFAGNDMGEKIRLQWTLAETNKANSVIVEKSYSGDTYQYVVDFWVNLDGDSSKNFRYADSKKGNKPSYYRLKITDDSGKVQYSNVLYFSFQKDK
jgi:hypothetical protein